VTAGIESEECLTVSSQSIPLIAQIPTPIKPTNEKPPLELIVTGKTAMEQLAPLLGRGTGAAHQVYPHHANKR